MPISSRLAQLDRRARLGVEIASTESRLPTAYLYEALSLPIICAGPPLAVYLAGNGLCYGLTFMVGENARFRKRHSHGERDASDVTDGVHTRKPGLHGMPVHRHPAAIPREPSLPDHRWRYVRRDVYQEIESRLCAVVKVQRLAGCIDSRNLMLWVVGNVTLRKELLDPG